MFGRFALGAALALGSAAAALAQEAQPDVAEEHTITELPADDPHRVWILDPVFPHLIAAKAYVVDGDDGSVVGMINAGYVPNLAFSADESRAFAAETFWSRGTRGDRIDVVTAYDVPTLTPTGEVVLPQGRFLVVSKKYNAGMTPDDRYLLSFNMAPATSVSVVDTETMQYVADIEVPGCGLVFPHGERTFSSLCADGSLMTVTFDETGQAETALSEPFFDPEQDPVFDTPAYDRHQQRGWFVTYGGTVHPVDFSGAAPSFGETWSLLGPDDAGWRPGGWQPFAAHPASNRLFVLMHQGGEWTHKQAGEEVWVFDLATGERTARIPLEEHAAAVAVSRDDAPLLYTLSEIAVLDIWDAGTGEHRATVDQIGESPLVLYVPGE